jgi:hypothetical protein
MWADAQCLVPYICGQAHNALGLLPDVCGQAHKGRVGASQRKSMPYALCLMPYALCCFFCAYVWAGAQNVRAQDNLFY